MNLQKSAGRREGAVAAIQPPPDKKGFHEWYKYVYDEYLDIVICPEYKSLSYQCKKCPTRNRYIESRNCQKTVTSHIWSNYLEEAEDIRHSPAGKESYALRSQTIERVFGTQKRNMG